MTESLDESQLIRRQAFLDAMSTFPSGVTIVTTRAADGTPWGFTATAFCSVSTDPPLVLVCLAKSAQCYDVFLGSSAWVINVIHAAHQELALRFATRGADKFAGTAFVDVAGMPALPQAAVQIHCSRHEIYDGGDHSILLGHVDDVAVGEDVPVIYFGRGFHNVGVVPVESMSDAPQAQSR